MATNITYKGSELASFSNNTKTLKTAGKYLEGDITVSASTVLGTTSVTPSETAQNITPGAGYDGLSSVTVAEITNTYVGSGITTQSTVNLAISYITSSNKLQVQATAFEGYYPTLTTELKRLDMDTEVPNVPKQNATTIIPSETAQTAVDIHKWTRGTVTVAAITPTYIGSGVTTNPSITVSGPTVTVPSGYYDSQQTKTIADAVMADTITIPFTAVNNFSIDGNGLITATRNYMAQTNAAVKSAGYITTNDKIRIELPKSTSTYQLPTLPAQTFTPSSTTQTVASTGKYMLGDITVQPIPSEYIVPTGTLTITHAGTTSVTNYANVDVPVADVVATSLQDSFTTVNNVRKWEARWAAYCERDGWAEGGEIDSNSHLFDVVQTTTITPSSATQTVGGKYYMMEGTVTVAPVPRGDLKGMLTMPTDIDFSTGHTPTATWTVEPSGMVIYQCYGTGAITNAVYSSGYIENTQQIPAEYEAGGSYQLPTQGATTVIPSETAQTLSVNQKYMTGNVTVAAITPTYVGSGITRNPTVTVSGPSVTIPAGYYSSQQTKTVASGSVSTPSTTITANPTVNVSNSGLITASVTGSSNVAPSVSAGYISSGTAGTISVTGSTTLQLTTQGSTTVTPSSTTQTVNVTGKYMTGNVTVNPIPSQYIVPSGTYTISSVDSTNTFNVTNYASAQVTITDADSIAY